MKILMAHNYYQISGGEDISFRTEVDLLRKKGHDVICYTRDNHEINDYNFFQKVQLVINTIWSGRSFRDFKTILQEEKPNLVHFQNTFPLISPSALVACKQQNVPVVMSLRNYRLMCANALFLRNHQICEDCVGKLFEWPGIIHACYRNSHLQSTVVAIMTAYHRQRNTWINCINTFICLSEFSKNKFIHCGIPESKIRLNANFVEYKDQEREAENYTVFIGRFSEEKGVQTLLQSAENIRCVPLFLIGSGPLAKEITQQKKEFTNITNIGWLEHSQTMEVLSKARFLICPSTCYESFPRVIVEAYACGVPVIGSRLGAIKELVQDGITGLLVNPGDAEDLSKKMKWLWDHPEEARRMGKNARQYYLERLTPDAHYETLLKIYGSVLEGNH